MQNISVVIICKNAAATIGAAIHSALQLTRDVVVADSGSSDGTIEKIKETTARLVQIKWKGYGDAKNTGNGWALHDWILSIDADEWLDDKLIKSIQKAEIPDTACVFTMRRVNFLGAKPIYFGEWGNDIVLRIFNKQNAFWDDTPVHESLILKKTGKKVHLKGILHHHTSESISLYKIKLMKYAALNAEKHFLKGKKANWYKLYFSSKLNFIQNFIFKAGFLDGKEGLQIALAHAAYTTEKYKLLKEKYKKNIT